MTTSTERNRVELSIVEMLAERVGNKLGDRTGDRHPPPWKPDQQVRIGVLRPVLRDAPTDDSDTTPDDDAVDDRAEGDTAEAPPLEVNGVIGIDAVLEDTRGDITIEVEAAVTLYFPEFASFAEARDRQRASAEDDENLEPRSDATGHDDSVDPQSDDAAETPLTDEPVVHPTEPAPPAGEPEEEPARRRRAGIPIWDAWTRERITVTGLRATVAADGTQQEIGEQLRTAIRDAIRQHFQRPEASRPFTTATRTIPQTALESEAEYWVAVRERTNLEWTPEDIEACVTVFVEPLPEGQAQLSVSITNETVIEVPPMPSQDLSLYDCELRIRIIDGPQVAPQRFRLAPRDYRWRGADEVPGHGRGCVAVADDNGDLRTETLPRFLQHRTDPRSGHVPSPRFNDLASNPRALLLQISDAMRTFEREWEEWLAQVTDADIESVARQDLAAFRDEHRRFDVGRDCLELDPRLETAFKLANRVFEQLTGGAYDTWRLFQIVYIVLHLPALAAREHRHRDDLRDELEFVDVLWFPTGGGKTEAYLGLIVIALFYDRLRGKARGVTAWLKFPLRMLSVQQLVRVLRALVVAEDLRVAEIADGGSPFSLGYLVGGKNTPNQLRYPTDGWWPGLERAAARLAAEPRAYDDRVIIGNCPYCDAANSVGLDLHQDAQRLVHVCRQCDRELPVHMTDEEVYRQQPSVVISTVDKITSFAWNGEFTSFTRGPRFECPDHGYYVFGTCIAVSCQRTRREIHTVTDWKDPVPALIVQDEMHLLREDLGTFSSHYEGLLRALQEGGPSELPSKILAASATIEGFEAQLAQVYCRQPRRFPSPGWELDRSFYVEVTEEARRLFMGVQPSGAAGRKVEVSGLIASELLAGASELADDLEGTAAAVAAATGITVPDDELEAILFNYEVDLAFVNSKAHGSIIGDDFARLNDRLAEAGTDALTYRILTGDVTVPMLAEAIDLIEKADPTTPRRNRLRGLIGTSVVSHGVDLARLNTMVMCGLPTTTADYIQATARAGRTHVGLVVTVYDNWTAREVSSFTHFVSTHRFLERLVEPVPVNRWARNGVRRTLPGIAVAHVHDMARDTRWVSEEGLKRTAKFQPWWNNNAAAGAATELERRILDSYRSPIAGVNPTALEEELQSTATERWTYEQRRMSRFDRDSLTDLFQESVMTSLRDVDDPVTFTATYQAGRALEAVFEYRPEEDEA